MRNRKPTRTERRQHAQEMARLFPDTWGRRAQHAKCAAELAWEREQERARRANWTGPDLDDGCHEPPYHSDAAW